MQSVLLLVVEAERFVDSLRRDGDWSRRLGVPAHITLGGPWPLSLELPAAALSTVAAAARGTRYRLDHVGAVGDAVSLLPADEAPLLALRAEVLRAVGRPDAVDERWRLHLTVCRDASGDAVERVREAIGAALPISCAVDRLCLARLVAPDRVELTTL